LPKLFLFVDSSKFVTFILNIDTEINIGSFACVGLAMNVNNGLGKIIVVYAIFSMLQEIYLI